ncbi:MAG: hypothetical protein J0I93_14440 [Legionella sp.]|nr:hypothetical protein [Legionella sp.]
MKQFIEYELHSLQENPIYEDYYYLAFLDQLGKPGFSESDELFFIKEMVKTREEKQANLNLKAF